MEFWQQIALVIVGGLLTWLPSRIDRKKKRTEDLEDIRRAKAEELMGEVARLINKTWQQFAEAVNCSPPAVVQAPGPLELERVAALIDIYFPGLRQDLQVLHSERTKIINSTIEQQKKFHGSSSQDLVGFNKVSADAINETMLKLADFRNQVRRHIRQEIGFGLSD